MQDQVNTSSVPLLLLYYFLSDPSNTPYTGGNTGGISSSLVFTPVQGIELVNPNADAEAKVNNNVFIVFGVC